MLENTANHQIEAKKIKSRSQGIFQFFEVLQVEWISADLRYKLYRQPKDKTHWKKVCEGKRKTIENIAIKNNLPTIFNDEDLYEALRSKVIRSISHPLFVYRDEEQKQNQEYWDLYYYYYKGSEVRFELFGESKVGRVKSYKPLSHNIVVSIKSELGSKDINLTIDKVTRLL